jgi:hypothetical protein
MNGKCVNNQLIGQLSNHDGSNVTDLFFQTNIIWMGEHDHVFTYLRKKFKATHKVIKNKIIS